MRTLDAPRHRLIDELRGVEDSFVDFLASSKPSSGILKVLAMYEKPLGFEALAGKVRGDAMNSIHYDHIPLAAVRSVLGILLFARLVRVRSRRYSITDLGREVNRRMLAEPFVPATSSSESSANRSNGATAGSPEKRGSIEASAARMA